MYAEALGVENATVHVTPSTGSPACLLLAKNWIDQCNDKHKDRCYVEKPEPFRPTRLVYVGDGIDWSKLHLHEMSPMIVRILGI